MEEKDLGCIRISHLTMAHGITFPQTTFSKKEKKKRTLPQTIIFFVEKNLQTIK